MLKPTLLILADRGTLKAFHIDKTPTRGQVPRLIDSYMVKEGRESMLKMYTDKAGTLRESALAERMKIRTEIENRCFRKLAAHIVELLRKENPEYWGFAAPSEINNAIIDGLDGGLKNKLVLNVFRDLVNTPREKLLFHFERFAMPSR